MANPALDAFYSSISSEEDVRGLIHDKIKESLYVEFKTKVNRAQGQLDDRDKWHFSRALSGFANSDGGVLIWGVKTNKQDVAYRLKPISGVHDFWSSLKKSVLNSTQPVVDNVLLDVITSSGQEDTGYVKCLVPVSEKTPHRAMLADREYYKRTSDGFYRLEHFDLEDMFGRRPHPSLQVYLELRPRPADDPHCDFHFGFVNVGRGIAKHVSLVCRFDAPVRVVSGSGQVMDVTAANQGLPTVAYAENVNVIHPVEIVHFVGHAILLQPEKQAPVRIHLSWFCEGMSAKSYQGEVAPDVPTTA
jgi:hypothetical protein